MGRVLREAIESFPGDERVVIMGTGGLSHQLQGRRAGFLNPAADRDWLARSRWHAPVDDAGDATSPAFDAPAGEGESR